MQLAEQDDCCLFFVCILRRQKADTLGDYLFEVNSAKRRVLATKGYRIWHRK